MTIEYKTLEHWIPKQAAAEQAMLAEFEAGNYTIDNPLIKYNAYFINPLSAVVLFKTEEKVPVTVTVVGKTKSTTITHTFPAATTHILPIVGLYNNYNNTVILTPYRGTSSTIHIEVPDCVPNIVCHMDTTPEYLQDDIICVLPAAQTPASGFDNNSDCRWYINALCVFDMKRLKNGNLLMGSDRLLKMPYYMTGLYELSPCGKIYKEYRIPGGYHHDQVEMEDGNLLVLTEDLRSDTVEDTCVLVDRKTGEILKKWDYKKCLKPGEGAGLSYTDEDWFHNNAVWYDKNTNSLTFSGRHVDAMINIDFETGDLNWIIGDPETWPEHMQKYFFKPVGKDFEWQYEQHACLITPNGDVMCFDNHHNGTKVQERALPPEKSYSRGVRYRINTKDMTIEQVWQYGKGRGADFYSPYICNVEYYNEGHYMVHSGGIAYDKFGNPSDALGPYAAMAGGSQYSITTEVYDDKKMLELKVKGNFYRAEKIKLYSDGINLEMGEGVILGHLDPTKEFDVELPYVDNGEELPAEHQARMEVEFDKFTFFAKFTKGDMIVLLLEQGDEKHQFYISTTATPNKAMCCGSFLDSDERQTRNVYSKTGLKGTYKVSVVRMGNDDAQAVKYSCGEMTI